MVRDGAENGGWTLNLVNAVAYLPSPLGCPAPFILPNGECLGAAAVVAQSILTSGTYPQVFMTGQCPPACTVGAGGIARNDSNLPYSHQASVGIDYQVGQGVVIGAGYLHVSANRLVLGNGLNVSCPQGTSKPRNPPNAQGWLNPDGSLTNCEGTALLLAGKPVFTGLEFNNGGFLNYNNSIVESTYHGLTLQATQRIGSMLRVNGNYTVSTIEDTGNFTTFINLPQNQFDYESERASSNQDVRHRFVANFTVIAGDSGPLRQFGLSGIITLQSGRPFTMFTGGDSNGDTNPVTDRVGLSARNAYTGDSFRTVDVRVSRRFMLKAPTQLDLMLDVFNLFNRKNVDEVFTVYGSPIFCGQTPSRYGDAASVAVQNGEANCPAYQPPAGVVVPPQFFVPPAPNPNFGTPRTVFNPRQIQLAAKISF